MSSIPAIRDDLAQPLAFSIEKAAELSCLGRTRLFIAIKDGKLKARKFGRRTVILAPDLNDFLANLPVREVAA
ncbi:DNA-binding protein [Mesorhizobium sp. M2D.F.Ca.ET.171.01.1.1]|uniref:DNA-binding protein n=1 Tax=unclassified Mesorhizobium TaxID=325217 RepID=UPI001091A483|nr:MULTISPECIES: DNA-binding protein [unclassified Mesorhizobium]TGS94791.1 DNA-binding protein [Mesorhizobium sp. M2D.F.Ca.ET.178.01.1.1]TGT10573.1 DNA-binding protein [Mesorhizobium sp. M2D.F.Ca.ET.171.01.1.1]